MHKKYLSYVPCKTMIFTGLFAISLTLAVSSYSIFSSQIDGINEDVFAQEPTDAMTNMSNTNATMTVGPVTLGDPVIEATGMITGVRVLEVHPIPKIETSFAQNDTIQGGNITTSEIGTYESIMKPDGTLYGEGQGIFTTQNGQMGTWTGQGIGHVTNDGKTRFHGSLFFSTPSSGSLSFLNNMVGIFQYEVDQLGKTSAKVWEWK